jgi:hypothetical protein
MAVAPPEKINLEKSSKDEIYVTCSHFHLKTTIFERNKQERSFHEVVITRKGCVHNCTAQGKKGRFSCPVAPGGKGLKRYFDYYEAATGIKEKTAPKKKKSKKTTKSKAKKEIGKTGGTKG